MASGDSSADEFAHQQWSRIEKLRESLRKAEDRAKRTERAARFEREMSRWLDELLPLCGYFCLHDCQWPGSRSANIDHVVIGPAGVLVIDDKCQSQPVRRGADGRFWSGRYPFEREVGKAAVQAEVVGAILGTTAECFIAVHIGGVADGHSGQSASGVTVLSAMAVPSAIQRRTRLLTDAQVTELARRAIQTLSPRAMTAAWSSIPAQPPAVERRRALTARQSHRGRSRTRSPINKRKLGQRSKRREDLLKALFAFGVGGALLLNLDRVTDRITPESPPSPVIVKSESFMVSGSETVESAFRCNGRALEHHIATTGISLVGVSRSPSSGGPWTEMTAGDGWTTPVQAGAPSWVRLRRSGPGGSEALIFDQAPSGEQINGRC